MGSAYTIGNNFCNPVHIAVVVECGIFAILRDLPQLIIRQHDNVVDVCYLLVTKQVFVRL